MDPKYEENLFFASVPEQCFVETLVFPVSGTKYILLAYLELTSANALTSDSTLLFLEKRCAKRDLQPTFS